MARLVLFGHAAFYESDGQCKVPENTTITFYSPPGALLEEAVCSALAHGEKVSARDITLQSAALHFFNKGIDHPNTKPTTLHNYPKTFKAGDLVPNYFLNPEKPPSVDAPPINRTETTVVSMTKTTQLQDLLETYKGSDIHWAACSFAKDTNSKLPGYGYACKLANDSPLKEFYKKSVSQQEKKKMRAQRFSTPSSSSSMEISNEEKSTNPEEKSSETSSGQPRPRSRYSPY